MLEGEITISGRSVRDLRDALKEIAQRLAQEGMSGSYQNSDWQFAFTFTGEEETFTYRKGEILRVIHEITATHELPVPIGTQGTVVKVSARTLTVNFGGEYGEWYLTLGDVTRCLSPVTQGD